MKPSELKPCPFCGGEATLDSPSESDSPFWCIYSRRCDGNGCEPAPAICMVDRGDAIAAWNRRDTAAERQAFEAGYAAGYGCKPEFLDDVDLSQCYDEWSKSRE